MNVCRNCGAQMVDETGLCRNCGMRQDVSQGYQMNNQGYQGNQGYQNGANYAQGNSTQWVGQYPPNVSQNISAPTKKNNNGLIIGLLIAAAIIIVILAIVGVSSMRPPQPPPGAFGPPPMQSGAMNSAATGSSTPAETSAPASDVQVEYAPGIISGSTYESEFIGIKYTKPAGWTFESDAELEDMSDDTTTWEMSSQSIAEGCNVSVAVCELDSSAITVDTYLEGLKAAFTNDGDGKTAEKGGTKTIAGKTYFILTVTGNSDEYPIEQKLYLRKIDDRMVVITVTKLGDADVDVFKDITAY